LRPVCEILHETLARVVVWARELGCVEQLAPVPDLVRRGGGAGVQRAIYELAGIDGLTKRLTDLTASAAGPGQRGLDAGLHGRPPRAHRAHHGSIGASTRCTTV
jgi:hypothetical protein